ncbi:MAG: purine-nucleoside phosphorylase [Desulfobulbaceae bacterium A2]|nr:MAG: purine-nucleoside phosphorylase [Desulfobulbaceae bacterium A2]
MPSEPVAEMAAYCRQVETATAFLHDWLPAAPEVVISLGTGLGGLAAALDERREIAYDAIPGFPLATAPGHEGNLLAGRIGGRAVLLLQGRFHCYEGYSAREVALPIRVAALLGARTAIITNAAGGLNPGFAPGDLMVLADHINLLGDNPLRGPNVDGWGIRFPDLSQPYDPELQELALACAHRLGQPPLRRGVYVCIPGPSLETPAETRFFRACGADAIGMSSIPEVLVALHAGLKVLGLSVIANVNNPERMQPILLEEIVAGSRRAEPRLQELITAVIKDFSS